MSMFRIIFLLLLALPCISDAQELHLVDAKHGEANSEMFGSSCEGLGDINGDGYADFLIGGFRYHELYLYLGAPTPFDNPPVLTWANHGTASGLASHSPVNVGDINCDGTVDFITSFSEEDTLILFLGLDELNKDDYLVISIDEENTFDKFKISGKGDNNGDGRLDFWVFINKNELPLNATVNGYSGCDLLDNNPDFSFDFSYAPDYKYSLPQDMCSHCDLNGDSNPEIIYGQHTSGYDYSGRVCIVWGSETISSEPDLVFYNPPDGSTIDEATDFGEDLACLGDISGDGIDDLWVNRLFRNYIYFGGRPFDTIPDIIIDYGGIYPDIENIGDVNDDGYSDIALFLPGGLYSNISYIYCYPGMDTLIEVKFTDEDFFQSVPDEPVWNLGQDHSWVGDVNGDGFDDILISAATDNNDAWDKGWIYIQAGKLGFPLYTEGNTNFQLPNKIMLEQNHPNPFNSNTNIEFYLPRSGHTEISIYNILGEKINKIIDEYLTAGLHIIQWSGVDSLGNEVASGIYIYQLKNNQEIHQKKMIFIK